MRKSFLKTTALTGAFALSVLAGPAQADAMSDAMEFVNKYAMKVDTWDGPTSGPAAVADQTIVVLAGDLKNGGIRETVHIIGMGMIQRKRLTSF